MVASIEMKQKTPKKLIPNWMIPSWVKGKKPDEQMSSEDIFKALDLSPTQKDMHEALKKAFGADLNSDVIRQTEIFEAITNRFKAPTAEQLKTFGQGNPVQFKSNKTGNKLAVTKDSINFVGERSLTKLSMTKRLQYEDALDMVKLAALDIDSRSGLTLKGSVRERALMLEAITEVNMSLPKAHKITVKKGGLNRFNPLTEHARRTAGRQHGKHIRKNGSLERQIPLTVATAAAAAVAAKPPVDVEPAPAEAKPVTAGIEESGEITKNVAQESLANAITSSQSVKKPVAPKAIIRKEVFNNFMKYLVKDGVSAEVTQLAISNRLARSGFKIEDGSFTQAKKQLVNILDSSGITTLNDAGNKRTLSEQTIEAFAQPETGAIAKVQNAIETTEATKGMLSRTIAKIGNLFNPAPSAGQPA